MVLTQLSHMDFAILAGDEFPYHYGSFTFGGQSHFVRPVFASQRPVPLRRPKNAEDGGPFTDNVVFTAFSGSSFLSAQRFLDREAETSSA